MKRKLIGMVVADNMDKTRVVAVEMTILNRKLRKQIKRQQKYYMHDEENVSKVGNMVQIEEGRPLSKTKRWVLVKVVR